MKQQCTLEFPSDKLLFEVNHDLRDGRKRFNWQAWRNARFIVLLKMQDCYFKNKSLLLPQWKNQHSSFFVQMKVTFYNRREYYISLHFKM